MPYDNLHAVRRELTAARRAGDPFRVLPLLQEAADAGYGWAAGELHNLQSRCRHPGRVTAGEIEAGRIEAASRRAVRGVGPPMDERAEAERIALRVAQARREDAACATIDDESASASWRRVVEMAKAGNEGARQYVSIRIAREYARMRESGELPRGDPLEQLARDWLLAHAMRGLRDSQYPLADSLCKGGLFPQDATLCYAWRRFLLPEYDPANVAHARLDDMAGALTSAQRDYAERLVRFLQLYCRSPLAYLTAPPS